MKRLTLGISTGVLVLAMAGPAAASPDNASSRAVEATTQGCAAVLSSNPNTGPSAPNAGTPGAANFLAVGTKFCFTAAP